MINANSLETTEVRYVAAALTVTHFQVLFARVHGVRYFVEHNHGWFYVLSNADGALNYAVSRVSVQALALSEAAAAAATAAAMDTVLPHSAYRLLMQMEMHREHLAVYARENNEPAVLVLSLDTPGAVSRVPLPAHLVR